MRSIQQQRGMTAIGWLLVIAMVVFFFFVGIKLVPAYINQFSVSSVLSSLEKEPDIGTLSSGEITAKIMKRLDINMVNDVQAGDIYITQAANHRIIEIDYEVHRKLFANIDILIRFNDKIEVPLR